MGDGRYPNLSWYPKPPFVEDFDGTVAARTTGGSYVITATAGRVPGTTDMAWFGHPVFVATFEPADGDILALTAAPTTRIEAQKLVKVHQRPAIDEQESRDQSLRGDTDG